METIIAIITVGAVNILCFLVGARVGQMVKQGQPVQLPNPVAAVKDAAARRHQEKEDKTMEALWHNIECYDGTAQGQKEVPQ